MREGLTAVVSLLFGPLLPSRLPSPLKCRLRMSAWFTFWGKLPVRRLSTRSFEGAGGIFPLEQQAAVDGPLFGRRCIVSCVSLTFSQGGATCKVYIYIFWGQFSWRRDPWYIPQSNLGIFGEKRPPPAIGEHCVCLLGVCSIFGADSNQTLRPTLKKISVWHCLHRMYWVVGSAISTPAVYCCKSNGQW